MTNASTQKEIATLKNDLKDKLIPETESLRDNLLEISNRVRTHRRRTLAATTGGVVVTTVGAVCTCVGFALGPFTFGAGYILAIVGAVAGGGGGIVTIAARVADSIVEKRHLEELKKSQSKFLRKKQDWFKSLPDFPELVTLLNKRCYQHHYHIGQAHVLQWIKLGLFQDVKTTLEEIVPGHHIFRWGTKKKGLFSRVYYHHGVCIGVNEGVPVIAQFDRKGARISSLPSFAKGSELIYRRDYQGFDLTPEKTADLAHQIIQSNSWPGYHLLRNNCEHFATHLKLGNEQPWSGQVKEKQKILNKVLHHAPSLSRLGHATLDIISVILPVTRAVAKVSTLAVSAISKASTFVSPIAAFIDGGMLAWDFSRKDSNQEKVDFAVSTCDEQVELFNEYLEVIKNYEAKLAWRRLLLLFRDFRYGTK